MAVIGLGYVGLPLAVALASRKFRVVGVDVSAERLDQIQKGEVALTHSEGRALKAALRSGHLTLTTNYATANHTHAFLLCLPTPVTAEGKQDLRAIQEVLTAIRPLLTPGALVVLESTVTPGTTRHIIAPLLSGWGWTLGKDLFLGYSPERIDPGNTAYPVARIPKIVSGVTPECLRRTRQLYEKIVHSVVPVSDPTVAEMAKVYENVFRAVNIGLANELAVICDRLGISAQEVMAAAATKPFGFMKFNPGAGIGGHCIPLAPYYLAEVCEQLSFAPTFPGLAVVANTRMVPHILGELSRGLESKGKRISGSRILVVGVAYKPGVSDTRHAPGVRLLQALRTAGASVDYYDPLVPELLLDGQRVTSLPDSKWKKQRWDAAVVVTAHPGLDLKHLPERASVLLVPGARSSEKPRRRTAGQAPRSHAKPKIK